VQDESKQKGTTMTVPVKERLQKCRLRGTDHAQWHVGSVGGTVLKSERKTKGPRLGLLETCKKRKRKRGHQ
jgi:hypothetical protein